MPTEHDIIPDPRAADRDVAEATSVGGLRVTAYPAVPGSTYSTCLEYREPTTNEWKVLARWDVRAASGPAAVLAAIHIEQNLGGITSAEVAELTAAATTHSATPAGRSTSEGECGPLARDRDAGLPATDRWRDTVADLAGAEVIFDPCWPGLADGLDRAAPGCRVAPPAHGRVQGRDPPAPTVADINGAAVSRPTSHARQQAERSLNQHQSPSAADYAIGR